MATEILKRPAFHFFLIALLGLAVYSNTFNVPFHFDDHQYMIDNPAIKNIRYILDSSQVDDLDIFPDIKRYLKTRFIAYLSFWVNYKIGGRDVTGYHVVNTAVHVINAMLVYMIIRLSFMTPFLRGSGLEAYSGSMALFSGILFVAHPVQTMAVTYILQRWASLAAMFYMLSIVLYVKWRLGTVKNSDPGVQGKSANAGFALYYLAALLSCVLAMKTKESAFTLPLMITLYESLFFTTAHSARTTVRIRKRGHKLLYLIPFFAAMLIIPFEYIGLNINEESPAAMLKLATTLEGSPPRLVYFLSQFEVIKTYIRLLFMPVGQSIYYDDMLYDSFSLSVFLSILFLVAVLGIGIYFYYRSRVADQGLRLLGFGIFWFFIALSVESSILPINDVIFEYRIYLPSAGAFMAIASAGILIILRLRSMQKAALYATIAVVLVFSGATYARNTVWHSEIKLWKDTVRKAYGEASGYYFLGKAYEAAGLTEKSIEAYKDCIELQPDATWAHAELAAIYLSRGMADKAIEHYRIIAQVLPGSPTIYKMLGNVYQSRGLIDNAIQLYQISLNVDPNHASTHNNLGVAYRAKGMMDKAVEHLSSALKLKPDYVQAHYNLGLVYLDQGLKAEARREFEEALRIDPDYVNARESLDRLDRKPQV